MCILDSSEPPTNYPTVDEPLPTTAVGTQPEPTPYLPPETNLLTLQVLPAELP